MTSDWRIYLITDRHQTGGRGLVRTVGEALAGGVRLVQLREKDLPPNAILAVARELRELTARVGARLLINGRLDVMFASGADGVHVRADGFPAGAVRRVIGPHALLGVSTHSLEEAQRAAEGGADFITFGPVFETPSKIPYGPPVGVAALERVCRSTRLPVFALGGVSRARVREVMNAGAFGAALISEVMSSRDAMSAARACVEAARTTKT